MIDTITIVLEKEQYKIIEAHKFDIPFEDIDEFDQAKRALFLKKYNGRRVYIQNPSSKLRKQNIIYPNLRIDQNFRSGFYSCTLKLTISCPKLLWSHSYKDITDNNLKKIIVLLKERLKDMGIETTESNLINAKLTKLHYCKNIIFKSQADTQIIIDKLSRTSLGDWYEVNVKTYANDGRAIRFHCDIFELVFYLKYYDALETANRSVGKNITAKEKQIALEHYKNGTMPPVVRMEVRFNTARSISSHLKAALKEDRPAWTFSQVFSEKNSLTTLNYYWNEILSKETNYLVLCHSLDNEKYLKIFEEFSNDKFKTIAEGIGLFSILQTCGVKRTKKIIQSSYTRKTWYKKVKKIVSFAQKYTEEDKTLIKIVTNSLKIKE